MPKLCSCVKPLLTFLPIGLACLFFAPAAHATAPSFTGLSVVLPIAGGAINLRSQGAVTGSAPMTVQSVSVLPLGLGVTASIVNGVCVQVNNLLGIDLLSAGAVLSVVVSNPDAPRGVRGTIVVLPGLAGNNDLGSCADASSKPIANAGASRTVADSDGSAGELVTLDASASVAPDGRIASYLWTDLTTGQVLGTTAVLQARLGDGSHQIELTVANETGGVLGTASSTINVVVQAAAGTGGNGGGAGGNSAAPTPNPGPDRSLLDTDGLLGEVVTLDASASLAVGSDIVLFEWLDAAQNLLGVGVTVEVRLPDGINNITLRVTASNELTSIANVQIAVGTPLVAQLLETLPGLTDAQRAVAGTFDDLCSRLRTLAETQPLVETQVDLLNRCSGITDASDPLAQAEALDELGAREFVAIRTQALLFSQTQYAGVMGRLASMRSGLRGFNVSGLTVNIDGKPVPVEQLQTAARTLYGILGGGAGADGEAGDESGRDSLLGDRLGLWLRGNLDSGSKEVSVANDGFEGDQWGVTGGMDYRFPRGAVFGLAFGYGKSDIDFQPLDGGGLRTDSWTATLYGSFYPAGGVFVDAVLNYGNADYDTTRRIAYNEGGNAIDRTALGATGGRNLSGGVSLGYDLSAGAFTVSPTVGYFASRADVDAFAESGAAGLDLAYDDQSYRSSTLNASLAASYAISTPWFVVIPHARGEYLHELEDDVQVFGVRFANDPFNSAANPTPPIIVRSDDPDQWYWRFAAGVSAQFKFGISGYVEYQRLEDFQYVDFENTTIGLRLQRSVQ